MSGGNLLLANVKKIRYNNYKNVTKKDKIKVYIVPFFTFFQKLLTNHNYLLYNRYTYDYV